MRRNILSPVGNLALIFLLGGCTDDLPLHSGADPRLRDRVVRMGFRPDMIVDQGASFLVEGDIEIDKGWLGSHAGAGSPGTGPGRAPGGPRSQYIGDRTVSHQGFAERTLHVYISSVLRSQQPEWARAVREAMAHWSQLGGFGLTFTETASESAAHILVTSYTHDVDEVAKSAWPQSTSGNPGPWVKINLGYRRGAGPGGQPVYASKVFHVVHELGHTLGFRHANWLQLGEMGDDSIGAHLIQHTSAVDTLSVMNGGPSRRAWSGFSDGDRIAARVAYTGAVRPVPAIEGGHPRLSWSGESGAVEYHVFRESGFPFSYIEQVGATTGTAFTDTTVTATEARLCGIAEFAPYTYSVLAYFPEGTVTRRATPAVCVY